MDDTKTMSPDANKQVTNETNTGDTRMPDTKHDMEKDHDTKKMPDAVKAS